MTKSYRERVRTGRSTAAGSVYPGPRRALLCLLAGALFAIAIGISERVMAAPEDPWEGGQWGPVIAWPHVPVSAANLPDGRVLTWSGSERLTWPSTEQSYTSTWDPSTGTFTEIFHPSHNMFCAHLAMLPDGKVFVNGGRNQTNSPWTSLFDYSSNEWQQIENMATGGRWYPTTLALGDGSIFTAIGTATQPRYPEVWDPAAGWTIKNGVDFNAMVLTPYGGSHGESNWWPLLHVAPNGQIFHSGPTPQMHYIDPEGGVGNNGSFTNVGSPFSDWYSKHGTTVMYDEGKLLTAGGWTSGSQSRSVDRAFTIDLNGPAPDLQLTDPMNFERKFHNGVILPNGEVLVIGGNTSGSKFSDNGAILAVEFWSPATGQWRIGASMSEPRNYHSVALLLPDGTVYSGGGGYCSGNPTCGGATHPDAQIYSPPYLFTDTGVATRPQITGGPQQIGSGTVFTVAATAGLQSFSMIKMSATTHGMNTDVRFLNVPFTETSPGNYELTAHPNQNVLTPGYWMLFGLDTDGVPSVAHVLQANAGAVPSINAISDQYSALGVAVALQIVASDPDNDPLTYSATGLPPGLSIDPLTGLISGVPFGEGDFPVTVTVDDSDEGTAQRQFTWTIFGGGLGFVTRQWWTGLAGAAVSDLTSSPNFPDNPDGTEILTSFEGPVDSLDNYGSRIFGYLEPDVSGLHTFWISSDDNGELWLSTDTDPANSALIAQVPGWSASQEWTKYVEQQSAAINLVAGQRYYIEALQKEGTGSDNLAVAWQRPGDAGPQLIDGAYLSTHSSDVPQTLADTFSTGIIDDIGSNWVTVSLPKTYTNMVVVATPQYDAAQAPAIARVRNAGGNSFDVRIQSPSDVPLTGYRVQYVVVEAGIFDDGTVKFEAGTHLSTITDAKKSWVGEAVAYGQNYVNPVVLGQVMTANDARWSNFWASSENRRKPPTPSELVIGKHVAEDPDQDRLDETIGYIVIEAGTGFLGDFAFEAGVGEKIVAEVIHPDAPFLYPLSSQFTSAAVSTAGMDGGNGGWPLLYGPSPLGITDIALAYDEDQVKDSERSHAAEQVAYLVLSGDVEIPLEAESIDPVPTVSGNVVGYTVVANREGLEYSFSWGDGTPATPFGSDPNGQHTYAGPGRVTITITIRDPATGETITVTIEQLIHSPLTANQPTQSSTIVVDSVMGQVWNVNPDNDTVTVIDASSRTKIAEIPVGDQPASIAVGPGGTVWVTNKRSSSISILSAATFDVIDTIALDSNSAPHGIAMRPSDSGMAYVALEATGDLLAIDSASYAEIGRRFVGQHIRHVSVSADDATILVSRFVTPPLPGESTAAPIVENGGTYFGGKVTAVAAATMSIVSEIDLQNSDRLASEHTGPGVPNYLGPAVVSPDGLSAWVPSKQDNILAGGLRGGDGMTFDQTVRAVTSKIDMLALAEEFPARIDHDDSSIANFAAFDNYGAYVFTTLEGNRQFTVSDAYTATELLRVDTGKAPHGIALSDDATTLYVHNFMDRSVGIYDIASITQDNVLAVQLLDVVPTVAVETLSPQVLLGKQLFYDARDPRLAAASYMSCASCHNDGGQDGRVWDFTDLGEGLRNTIALDGRAGMAHGMVHWTNNFNEIQDFEDQIRNFAGGSGLMDDADYSVGTRNTPLGDPKAGLSADLDALAAYISSLTSFPASPYRNADGTLTPDGEEGLLIFERENCASCHTPVSFTDSFDETTAHDVGTITPASGTRLSSPLPLAGLDTPTLLGVWQTMPYLHDGSAFDLTEAVAAHTAVGISLTPDEANKLAAYLEQLDDATRAISNVAPDSPVQFGSLTVAQPDAGTWHTVVFPQTFPVSPIVVMGPPSFQDPEPTTVRVRNVTASGFEFQIDEWEYLDGTHGAETLSWIAVEPGVHELGGLTVEAMTWDGITDSWFNIQFSAGFAVDPIVLNQVVGGNGPTALTVRMRNVDTLGFKVHVQQEEAQNNAYPGETLHFVSISTGTGVVNGKAIAAGNTGVVVGSTPQAINFGSSFPSPLFFGSSQHKRGGDPAAMRYTGLSPDSVNVFMEEETSADAETHHAQESVGWLVISNQ